MDGHTPAALGVVALGASIGPMARRVEDLALLFKVLAEPTQFEAAQNEAEILNPTALRGLRVAWYTDDGVAPVSDDIRAAVQNAAKALADAGLKQTKLCLRAFQKVRSFGSTCFHAPRIAKSLRCTRAGKARLDRR